MASLLGRLRRRRLAVELAVRRYAPITAYMGLATLKKEAAGTFGSFLWWIAEPLLFAVVYYFVFVIVFQWRTENVIAFLLVGLVSFRWMSLSITQASMSVSANAGLLRQVHVPKVIFPLQAILVQFYKFAIALAIVLLFVAALADLDLSRAYYLPLVLVAALSIIVGSSLVLSILMPIVPDLRNVLQLAFRALLFLSGIFFEATRVPEELRVYFYMNPFATLIESFRAALIFGEVPSLERLLYVTAAGALLCAGGLYLHVRLNRFVPRLLI